MKKVMEPIHSYHNGMIHSLICLEN